MSHVASGWIYWHQAKLYLFFIIEIKYYTHFNFTLNSISFFYFGLHLLFYTIVDLGERDPSPNDSNSMCK